jgi:hypothetical protein
MRCERVMLAAASIGLACLAASCTPPLSSLPPSPGCLIHLYTGPDLTGSGIPVARDTPELAPAWRDTFTSARIIWGTWRLFASPNYTDFMGDYASPAVVPQLRPNDGLKSLKCIAPEPPPPVPPGPPGVYVAP